MLTLLALLVAFVISFNGMMNRVILDFMLPGYFAFVGKPFNEISGVVIKWA